MLSRLIFYFAFLGSITPGGLRAAQPVVRPNILFILADDMGFSDAGCYGGEIATPNLDRLAANGVRFTQFYNTGRCWPTRAALLTGYYPQQIRMDPPQGRLPGWSRLLPTYLKPLGYRSYHSGKWHVNGAPRALADGGFDRSYRLEDHDRNFYPTNTWLDETRLPPVPKGTNYYTTVAFADFMIHCLKEHAAHFPGQPFFGYLAFTVPHFPLQAPADDIARYRDRYLAGWDAIRQQRHQRQLNMGLVNCALSEREASEVPYWNLSEEQLLQQISTNEVSRAVAWNQLSPEQKRFQATKMAIHAAMIDRMDREIGRVLEQLQAMGALENTIVMFASDNGASAEFLNRGDKHNPAAEPGSGESFLCLGPGWSTAANTPFRLHKSWVHEGGISTPLIVHWPRGIAAKGKLRHGVGHVIDIVPTILELAGAQSRPEWNGAEPPPFPGRSLVPALAKDKSVPRDFLYFHHEHNRALLVDTWKLVSKRPNTNDYALYNLSRDRCEQLDLAGKQPQRVAAMAKRWQAIETDFRALAATGAEPKKDIQTRPGSGVTQAVFHVSLTGKDSNPGTSSEPFATLERAREAVRLAATGLDRKVIVHAGSYELGSTLALHRLDSGTAAHPVTWQAAPGEQVRLVGGISVTASAWQNVIEAQVLARLDPAARGWVMEVDLRTLGVTNLPPFPVTYHGVPPGPELFFNDNRMTLARWPNQGWATIARIVESGSRPRDGDKRGLAGSFEYAGDRPAGWRASDGVWLQGYWCYDWYDEVIQVAAIDPVSRRISLAAPHIYSLMQGNPSPRRYRALNVLEELDQPGEFVIDRAAGRLYLWPPADLSGARVTLATLDAPLVSLQDATYITMQGFVVEAGLDNGIEVTHSTHCEVVGCEVRNLRRVGIRVAGGTSNQVLSCDIHHTGQGGLVLGGGDRKTLTPAGHQAVNNHIWRFSEHQLTSAYGLSFEGVGNRAAHNLIHDAPHQAVFVGGNDHVFEFNEVHHVCTETDDCGALYKGRNPSCRGNQIRFNYWHDIGSPMGHGNAAVYFDDGDGGDSVFGNVFVRCGEPGKGSFGTVFSHGGHDIRAENNIFVDCKRALGSAPWDDARWRDALKGGQDCFFVEKLRQEVDITKPPYTTRYPELVGYLDPRPDAPRVNLARLNLLVRCAEASGGNWRFDPNENWSTNEDPGFVNGPKGDYRLIQDASVFKHLPGFRTVPFEKMGLQRQQ